MKSKVLLIDDSLTVQKVVALSLDRVKYQILFAKGSHEAMRAIVENDPMLVLVSDNVPGLSAASFPKEVELRLGRNRKVPPMILISGKNGAEAKHYAAWLQKPFTPQLLVQMIESLNPNPPTAENKPDVEDQSLQSVFESAFPHESDLARETFRLAEENAGQNDSINEPNQAASMSDTLWGSNEENSLKFNEQKMPTRKPSDTPVQTTVNLNELDKLVSKKLDEVLPAIVEKIVQERLDKLLNSSDQKS